MAELALPASARKALPPTHIARRTASGRLPPRLLGCFRRGVFALLANELPCKSLSLKGEGRLHR